MRLGATRRLFISYRRRDFSLARHVHAWAVRRYGAGRVFLDHEDNVGADHWAERVEQAVRSSAALVAVIGPGWVERAADLDAAGEAGESPSLANRDGDWVLRELTLAAAAGVPVRPFYVVADPRMPAALTDVEGLPADVRSIVTTPQVVIGRPDQFDAGLHQLGQTLDPLLGRWGRRLVRLTALAVVVLVLAGLAGWLGCRAAGCFDPSPLDPDAVGVVVAEAFAGEPLGDDEARLAAALAAEIAPVFGTAPRVTGAVDDPADAAALADRHGAKVVIGGELAREGTRISFRPAVYLGALPDLEELNGQRLSLALPAGSTNADPGDAGAIDDLVGGLGAGFAPVARLVDGATAYRLDRYGEALDALEPALPDLGGLEGAAARQLAGNMYTVFDRFDEAIAHYDAALTLFSPFPRAELGRIEARFLLLIDMPGECAIPQPADLLDLAAAAAAVAVPADQPVVQAKADLLGARITVCHALRTGELDTADVRAAAERLAAIVGTRDPPDELNEAVVLAARTLGIVAFAARNEPALAEHLLATSIGDASDLAALHEALLTTGIETTRRPSLRADAYLDRANLFFDLQRRPEARADYVEACRDTRDLLGRIAGNGYDADDGFEQSLRRRIEELDLLIVDVDPATTGRPCTDL